MFVNSLVHQTEKTPKTLKFLKKQFFNDFLKSRIFRKLTTDFEYRTKCQAETKPCIIYVHRNINLRMKSKIKTQQLRHLFSRCANELPLSMIVALQ